MAAPGKPSLIERLPTRLDVDYLVAALVTGALVFTLWQVDHLDPVADSATRRVVYGAAAAGGLGLAWAVYTWTQATYSDSSPRMSVVRARQGSAIRRVRFQLMIEALLLSGVSLVAMLVDKDLSWRAYVFYPWLVALLAVAVGLARSLRLQWRLLEIREVDDKVADGPPVPQAFTWKRSA